MFPFPAYRPGPGLWRWSMIQPPVEHRADQTWDKRRDPSLRKVFRIARDSPLFVFGEGSQGSPETSNWRPKNLGSPYPGIALAEFVFCVEAIGPETSFCATRMWFGNKKAKDMPRWIYIVELEAIMLWWKHARKRVGPKDDITINITLVTMNSCSPRKKHNHNCLNEMGWPGTAS